MVPNVELVTFMVLRSVKMVGESLTSDIFDYTCLGSNLARAFTATVETVDQYFNRAIWKDTNRTHCLRGNEMTKRGVFSKWWDFVKHQLLAVLHNISDITKKFSVINEKHLFFVIHNICP